MSAVLETLPPAVVAPLKRSAPSMLTRNVTDLRVLPSSQRDAALSLWRTLENRFNSDPEQPRQVPLAVSSDWTEIWLRHYGSVVPHEFLVLSDHNGPVGITLLTSKLGPGIGPFREKSRHLGTAGEQHGESVCVEHNQLLVLPSDQVLFHEHLVTHVLQDKSWESLRLDGFTEGQAAGLLAELPGFEVRRRESPYYDLKAAREAGGDPLDRLGRSTRQNVRRLLRKSGEIQVTWAEAPDEAREIFDELVMLHQARWRAVGQPGAFASPKFLGFQRSLIEHSFRGPSDKRRVVLFRARQGEQTIGCLLLLIDCNRLLDYVSGLADFNVVASPGMVTHTLGIQEALKRGYDAYDFLVGEKRHKDNLSTDVNHLVWATWSRPTLRSRTISTLRRLKRRWKEIRSGNQPPASAAPTA
jgi:hypothetical protein